MYLNNLTYNDYISVSQLREELDAVGVTRANVERTLMDVQRSHEELDRIIPDYDIVVR